MYNLPNILTISRIVVIPVIFLAIYIHSAIWSIFAGVLFVVASITDYLDGYFARSRNQNSVLGRLLDPIADKLLVVSALLIIVANRMVSPVTYIPVIIIMCREVLVSGMREFLAEFRVGMPVTRLAKWKTGFQMTALAMMLFKGFWYWNNIGEVLLWAAGILTFITGYQYFQKSLDYIKASEKVKTVEAKVVVQKEPSSKPAHKATSPKKKTAKKAPAKTKKK